MSQILYSDMVGVVDHDIAEQIILRASAEESPVLATLLRLGNVRESAGSEFKWRTAGLPERRTQINNGGAAYDGATTTLVVDVEETFRVNDLVLAEATGEIMLVTATNPGASSITVVRGIGPTSGAAGSVADDAFLRNIGYAPGEGADAPAASNVIHSEVSNYCQLFRETIELSGTAARQTTKTEEERGFQRRAKFEKMQRDIDHALLHGAKSSDQVTDAGKPILTMGGLLQSIVTYVDNVGGALSNLKRLEQFFELGFRQGSTEKYLFCGSTLNAAMGSLLHGLYEVTQLDGTNLRFRTFESNYGRVHIALHRGLSGAYAGQGVLVDAAGCALRPLKSREDGLLHIIPDIQTPGADAVRDEWRAELGLEYGAESQHAVIKGVTG